MNTGKLKFKVMFKHIQDKRVLNAFITSWMCLSLDMNWMLSICLNITLLYYN